MANVGVRQCEPITGIGGRAPDGGGGGGKYGKAVRQSPPPEAHGILVLEAAAHIFLRCPGACIVLADLT